MSDWQVILAIFLSFTGLLLFNDTRGEILSFAKKQRNKKMEKFKTTEPVKDIAEVLSYKADMAHD